MGSEKKRGEKFSIDECIIVLDLYRRLGNYSGAFDNIPENESIASFFRETGISNRPAKSIARKLDNFRYLDTGGKYGLENGGYATERVWEMYSADNYATLDDAVAEVRLRASIQKMYNPPAFEGMLDLSGVEESLCERPKVQIKEYNSKEIAGYNREIIQRVRVGQNLFRAAVLDNFNHRCCITGLGHDKLLRASHIRPWKDCTKNTDRISVGNGLCLNPLHDVAFDQGLITVNENLKVELSPAIDRYLDSTTRKNEFDKYEGHKIADPKTVLDAKHLKYHNRKIFISSDP